MIEAIKQPIHPDYFKYPSSDGEPMAESTYHQEWIIMIKENLEVLTEGADIFVASDLLWYPVEGEVRTCKAPDVMVCIDRPKGHRLSYLQWHEEGVGPQVVFEIFSKSNRRRHNKENLVEFYDAFGVEEFYSYDPITNEFVIYLRQDGKFTRLEGLSKWVSPLLNVRFELGEDKLRFYRPDGQEFIKYEELERENKFLRLKYEDLKAIRDKEYRRVLEMEEIVRKKETEVELAEQKANDAEQKANDAEQKANDAVQKASDAEQKANDAVQKASDAEQKASDAVRKATDAMQKAEQAIMEKKKMIEKLRELGIDPDSI